MESLLKNVIWVPGSSIHGRCMISLLFFVFFFFGGGGVEVPVPYEEFQASLFEFKNKPVRRMQRAVLTLTEVVG